MLDKRLDKINNLIFDIAAGNFRPQANIEGEMDELDAVITGINMLAEELERNTISRSYLKKIYDGMSDMVFILNNNGLIVDINAKVKTISGYSLDALKFNSFNTLFPFKNKVNFAELKSYINTYHKKDNITTDFITAQRSIIPVVCSFSMIRGNKPKDNIIMMIVKDMSELNHIRKELEERSKELNTFIYRASHDLQGPLATMQGLFNLIDIDADDPEKLKNYFALFKQSSSKLHKVVTELLDLGRITASGINYENIMVVDIVNEIREENTSNFSKVNFNIINSQDYAINTEPQILKSILYNLFDNSIKYTSPEIQTEIKVEILDSNKGIKINVSDNGVGIGKEIKGKIFDMFYRGNSSSKGSGLGLYIVKTGVEKLGGKVWLKSIPDRGSTFSIFLPHHNS